MDKTELKILELFNRYLHWIKVNGLKDTLDNYKTYFIDVEEIEFMYEN